MTLDEIKNINKEKCARFSVFAHDRLPMPGVKKRLDEVLNREILITDFRINKSKHRDNSDCLQIQFIMDDVTCVLFTGSGVLMNQIQSCRENIPFYTTIVKIDKYYAFS